MSAGADSRPIDLLEGNVGRRTLPRWCGCAEHAIDLGAHAVELLLQDFVPLERVASDFLINARRHSREVGDVLLEAWLPVPHRLVQQPGGNHVHLFRLVGVRSGRALEP